MDNVKNLTVVFTGNTVSLEKSLATIQTTMSETGAKADGLGASITKFGLLAGSVLIGIGVVASKMAMDFQQQMTYVRTQAGDTTDNIDQLGQSVLNLAKHSQYGPDELAKGLYHLASLGLRGADALNALNVAQELAAVGGANLETTTSALGGALVTGVKGTQNLSEAAGTLNSIVGAGNMRMDDLIGAMSTGVLPVFKNAGLTLTDFGAALATMTDNTTPANEAATRLRMTISLMEAPSAKAKGVLKELGMTSDQLGMDMQQKGLIPALADLKQHLLDTYGTTDEGKHKMAVALTEMFGGGRSSAGIQTLIDQLDRVKSKEQEIANGTGRFAQSVAEQHRTLSAEVKTAWSWVRAEGIQMGTAINNVAGADLPKLIEGFKQVYIQVSSAVAPSLRALWDTIETKLEPVLKRLWKEVIVPLIPVIGTILVAAFKTAVDILDALLKAITPVINFMLDNKGVVIGLATAFGILAIAMNLNAAFDAITIGFNTFKLITIPSSIASMEAFMAVVSTPMVMGAIAIGAALIALGAVYDAAQKARGAIEDAKTAAESADKSNMAVIGRLRDLKQNGTPDQKARATKDLANLGFARGGFTGMGGTDEVAGIVHKGEYVIPQQFVDQSTGTPKMATSASQTAAQLQGGGDVHIHINVGNYGGSEGELRNFARQIWTALQHEATSHGKTMINNGILTM